MNRGRKSYMDYIKTGELSADEAVELEATRDAARVQIGRMLSTSEVQPDAAAFGALDVIAVRLVQWYGAAAAAKVFRHYAAVCERQAGRK